MCVCAGSRNTTVQLCLIIHYGCGTIPIYTWDIPPPRARLTPVLWDLRDCAQWTTTRPPSKSRERQTTRGWRPMGWKRERVRYIERANYFLVITKLGVVRGELTGWRRKRELPCPRACVNTGVAVAARDAGHRVSPLWIISPRGPDNVYITYIMAFIRPRHYVDFAAVILSISLSLSLFLTHIHTHTHSRTSARLQ